jgi:ribonuclease BN (tRNA processing enzyme)
LSTLLDGEPFRGSLLLSHLHWDHYQGLPFFGAGDRADARATLYLPDQGDGSDAEAVLAKGMSPPNFPIRPSQLGGDWRFVNAVPGRIDVEDFAVEIREIPHKGGRTFGYRISDDHSSLTYMPDHCPTALGPGPDGWGEYHPAALELAEMSDVLVHDAHLVAEELATDAFLGHAAADYPIGLARRANARSVVLFHHRPDRTDEALDAIAKRYGDGDIPVSVAVEGATLNL